MNTYTFFRFLSSRFFHSVAFVTSAAVTLTAVLPFARAAGEDALKPYVPQNVSVPKDAPYVMHDGSIYVAGNNIAAAIVYKLNDIFIKAHPGFKFTTDLPGPGAMAGIASGKSAFGPIARDFSRLERNAFTTLKGYDATVIRIGWDNNPSPDYFPPGKYPPGIWVNAKNPAPYLTLDHVTSIFTVGSPKGDITHWGQIAYQEGPIGKAGGDWAIRQIHVYMQILPSPVNNTTHEVLGGYPWTPRAEYLPLMEDVINAVANDPYGVGLAGWWMNDWGWDRRTELESKVRLVALTKHVGGRISQGGVGDLYPLTGAINIAVDRAPGKPLEPWLKDYLMLALSKEGQDVIRSMIKSRGFIPLEPDDVPVQLAKLE